ncbi:hypothetical protein AHAS_Ahas08G0082300 [Arachis hypogaea]
MHCLFTCNKAKEVWLKSPFAGVTIGEEEEELYQCWRRKKTYLSGTGSDQQNLLLVGIVCWNIWRARNCLVFEHEEISPEVTY